MNPIHLLIAVPAALAAWFTVLVAVDLRRQAKKPATLAAREARERAEASAAKLSPTQRFSKFLNDLGWEGPIVPLLFGFSTTLVMVAVVLQGFGVPAVATILFGPLVTIASARFIAGAIIRRRRRLFTTQLTTALDMFASQLGQGSSMARVLADVGPALPEPLRSEILFVVDQEQRGRTVSEALSDVQIRYPSRALSLFTAAVKASEERGGRIAPTLEQAAASLRASQELIAEASADVAMEKFQFLGVTGIVGTLCLTTVIRSSGEAREVYTSPLGITALTIASAWFLVGVFVVNRLLAGIKRGD